MGIIKKQLDELVSVEYCDKCFYYKIKHPENVVFHGIKSRYLNNKKIITPPNGPLNELGLENYNLIFKKRKIHLGSLEITGPVEFDVHFAFELDKILKNHDCKLIDHYKLEEMLFHNPKRYDFDGICKDKYSYNDNEITEILLNCLNLKNALKIYADSALAHSRVKYLNKPTSSLKELRYIINQKNEKQGIECDCDILT